MSELKRSELEREEEFLLSRYHDGECHLIDRWRVHRLLARSSEAAAFLESLDAIGKQVTLFEKEPVLDRKGAPVTIDMWSRISRRIDEEERAAIFLGERSLGTAPSRVRFDLSSAAWGLAGSLATAAVAFIVVGQGLVAGNNGTDPGYSSSLLAASAPHTTGSLEQVSYDAAGKESERVASFRRVGKERGASSRPIELDWVRSDGTVRMIQNPTAPSAIIWVKRKQNPLYGIEEFHADETPNPDRPVMIEERIPKTFSVGGTRAR